ncbi:MAG: hypothetical protein WBA61_01560 [Aequorivita sp.]
MNFFKKIFGTSEKPTDSWTMFSTSKKEVNDLLVSTGQLRIGSDFLQIDDYPFQPSIAYGQTKIFVDTIDEIDIESYPPTIKVKDELIFLTSEKRDELKAFARRNDLRTVKRPDIWGWILEPFLDTEFTKETDERLTRLLNEYGLTKETVDSIRKEVKTQMLKYNFDTMLWEWGGLGAEDVLKAMRTKYDEEDFEEFYDKVMKIALLTKQTKE